MASVRHMVAALRGRALKLRVGATRVAFGSPQELAQFLSTRVTVPDERMQEFAKYDARALQREARKMLQAHQNVMDIMVAAKEAGEPLGSLWRRLDISKVPDDHDWPSILFELGNNPHIIEAYRREALSQYSRFVDVRRDALERFRPHPANQRVDESARSAAPPKVAAEAKPAGTADVLQGYARLPHSHAVEIDWEDEPDITVFLGTNRYHLSRRGETLSLREDQAGETYRLKPGRNTVGRSSQCDVRLGNGINDISRQHLIVEVNTEQQVQLTDVSSRGTYVRAERLAADRGDTITGSHS